MFLVHQSLKLLRDMSCPHSFGHSFKMNWATASDSKGHAAVAINSQNFGTISTHPEIKLGPAISLIEPLKMLSSTIEQPCDLVLSLISSSCRARTARLPSTRRSLPARLRPINGLPAASMSPGPLSPRTR